MSEFAADGSVASEVPGELVLHQQRGPCAWLTLNRPAAFNSLSTQLMAALQLELERLAEDEGTRVIVIAGSGRGFCAGHDLREVRANQGNPEFLKGLLDQCANLMQTIVHHPRPIIARVHGVATAAGCQLVASCDLAIAESAARFATPGVNIGLFCHTPMVALSRNVNRKQAMEMLLTGEMIDAHRAVDFGLINRAVDADQLDAEVSNLAATLASKSAYTLAVGKEAFYRQLEEPDLASAYRYAGQVMLSNMAARDAEEGIQAFIDKREPTWEDR